MISIPQSYLLNEAERHLAGAPFDHMRRVSAQFSNNATEVTAAQG
jgi:hypothetical protein